MKVHMSLPMKNLEATLNFYKVLFNEEPTKVEADYIKFDPQLVSFNLTFHKVSENTKIETSRHLGFELETKSELDLFHSRLKKAHLIDEERKTSVCCYANQDKFWVADPLGFRREFYQKLADTKTKMYLSNDCCIGEEIHGSSCC